MKTKKQIFDVDFIGGLGPLSKEDEQKLSEYFKNVKKRPRQNAAAGKKAKTKVQRT